MTSAQEGFFPVLKIPTLNIFPANGKITMIVAILIIIDNTNCQIGTSTIVIRAGITIIEAKGTLKQLKQLDWQDF